MGRIRTGGACFMLGTGSTVCLVMSQVGTRSPRGGPLRENGAAMPESIRVDVTPSEHVTAIVYPAAGGNRAGVS